MTTAKIFWSGRSQAVRLPKAFRFDADEVEIRREGDRVVLEPRRCGWPKGYWDSWEAPPGRFRAPRRPGPEPRRVDFDK